MSVSELHETCRPRMWDGQPSDFERQESMQASYSDDPAQAVVDALHGSVTVREDGTMVNGAGEIVSPSPLVCSVCGAVVDEEELSLEEVSEARQNPAVVLCEACGEDGVIEGDDE